MIIVEILELLFQTIWATWLGIISSLLKVLPEFLEMKKILSAFTPTVTDIIAFYLGVPVALVSAVIFLIKFVKKVKKY